MLKEWKEGPRPEHKPVPRLCKDVSIYLNKKLFKIMMYNNFRKI